MIDYVVNKTLFSSVYAAVYASHTYHSTLEYGYTFDDFSNYLRYEPFKQDMGHFRDWESNHVKIWDTMVDFSVDTNSVVLPHRTAGAAYACCN